MNKLHNKVYWFDPDDDQSNGWYKVTRINGEVITISNGVSEIEVPEHELHNPKLV